MSLYRKIMDGWFFIKNLTERGTTTPPKTKVIKEDPSSKILPATKPTFCLHCGVEISSKNSRCDVCGNVARSERKKRKRKLVVQPGNDLNNQDLESVDTAELIVGECKVEEQKRNQFIATEVKCNDPLALIQILLSSQMPLQECKTAELQECKTAELQECKTAELQECKTAELQECKTAEVISVSKDEIITKDSIITAVKKKESAAEDEGVDIKGSVLDIDT